MWRVISHTHIFILFTNLTPEMPDPETSVLVAKYDGDGNFTRTELGQVLKDYADGKSPTRKCATLLGMGSPTLTTASTPSLCERGV